MPENRRSVSHRKSMRIAFCGIIAGLSLVIMLLGGVLQIATFAAPLAAAVLLLPIRIEFGSRWAWATWITAAALSLLLGLDKEAGFFYLFAGYWPIVKWSVDFRVRKPWLRLAVKAVIFTVSVAVMYALLLWVVGMPELKEVFRTASVWIDIGFVSLTVFCLLLYDFLLQRLSVLYAQRLRPKLTFLKRL